MSVTVTIKALDVASDLLDSLFGSTGRSTIEVLKEDFLPVWQKKLSDDLYAYLVAWINERFAADDWMDFDVISTGDERNWGFNKCGYWCTGTYVRHRINRCIAMYNDLAKNDADCHLRSDWATWSPYDSLVEDQVAAVSTAGISGVMPILLIGGLLVGLLFTGKKK